MPNTTWGIWYPESTDHTRLWEHMQQLAESVDVTVIPPIYSSRSVAASPTFPETPAYVRVPYATDGGTANITYNTFDEWVIQYAGRYQISTTLTWLFNASGYRGIRFMVNGTMQRSTDQAAPDANNFGLTLAAGLTLQVGDVLAIEARNSASNGSLADLTASSANCFVDVTYTGRAL